MDVRSRTKQYSRGSMCLHFLSLCVPPRGLYCSGKQTCSSNHIHIWQLPHICNNPRCTRPLLRLTHQIHHPHRLHPQRPAPQCNHAHLALVTRARAQRPNAQLGRQADDVRGCRVDVGVLQRVDDVLVADGLCEIHIGGSGARAEVAFLRSVEGGGGGLGRVHFGVGLLRNAVDVRERD